MLSLQKFKDVVRFMKQHEVRPLVVESEAQAQFFNQHGRALGHEYTWHIGDEYYLFPVGQSKT